MKQFIYLDTDIVTSIIAQEEKGYIIQMSKENEKEETESKVRISDISASGNGEAKIWKIVQAGGKVEYSQQFQRDKGSKLSTKDIAEKTLHDAAFDIAYEYITPIKVQYNDQCVGEEGEYLEIQRVYDFVDFDYLEGLFNQDGIIEYIKKKDAAAIENKNQEAIGNINREQFRKKESEIRKRVKEVISDNNQKYDEIFSMLKAIRGLIPYSRMLVSNDGFIVPLDDKYFRINPSNLGFKYGGEMTCVGLITNIIGEDTNPCDEKNVFATLQYHVNTMLRSFLPTNNDNLCVIHPIAIYYGQ
ncbi:MAG: hypothetical protein K5663_03755 [Clostridiales bacterium]|nr:hypothetical protein [Clostridiales bacterium]